MRPTNQSTELHSSTGSRVQAVFFDMGGTLETIVRDDAMCLMACEHIHRILRDAGVDLSMTPEELLLPVRSGLDHYFADRDKTQRELPPSTVWRDYVFKQSVFADARLASVLDAVGEELAFVWDTESYRREMRIPVPQMLADLQALGLRIGIISNVFSVRQVYHDLARFEISHFFDPIVLSTSCGIRKPAPEIFHLATALAGVSMDACAYVGDSLVYDIVGAQHAGFGRAIWLDAPLSEAPPNQPVEIKADVIMHSLADLPELLQ